MQYNISLIEYTNVNFAECVVFTVVNEFKNIGCGMLVVMLLFYTEAKCKHIYLLV
jgi:hypothetical protein